jgi:hypothetical protein
MELEGFGASLIGRAIYVCSDAENAWVPWEYISGTPYSCKILVTGDGSGLRTVEAGLTWTAVFRPAQPKDWSMIATVLRALGPNILLVFDSYAIAAPPSFNSYLDGIVQEGRTVITRIWIGSHMEIPTIPDAIFFPVLHDTAHSNTVLSMIGRLPGRGNHGPCTTATAQEWPALLKATQDSNVGIVVSDIGENAWSLFWHKIGDSRAESSAALAKRGLAWIKTGMSILEKNTDA